MLTGKKNIILIEKDFIGSGATGRSAGMLTYELE
jgi:glycine/D-amino acid oxidase-like deaminating enzyme